MPQLFRPPPPRKRKHKGRKEFDFIPNKEQMIMGAFLDLGKPIKPRQEEAIARMIADLWNEDIS